MRLILASASPRRRELLATLGCPFEVVPSGVAEALAAEPDPRQGAEALALAKAREVARREPDALVLGADTVVVLDGRPLGKPGSPAEARAFLRALAGRSHEVITAVALVEAGRETVESVRSRVRMRGYAEAEIEAYLATGEPYDKAGGYAVQGEGRRLVAEVEGCYTNVVGLPLSTTARLLAARGIPVRAPAAPPRAP